MTLSLSPFRLIATLAVLSALGVLTACAGLSPRPVMPISEIVELGRSGSPDQAVKRLRTSKTTYALRGSDFGKLADFGVAPQVLDELQQSFANDVDLLTRYWVLGESLGGCSGCYPQPVDLNSLKSGGNGMADASAVHLKTTFGRPQGLPDWVSAVPGGGGSITIADVSRMVKDGVPAGELAENIRASRLRDVIATQGLSTISTHYVAGLSGSELAQLHKDGAADPVLDALQEKFLAEFIEFNRMRYQSWGKGGNSWN
jgi:hypothetical protein